MADFGYNLSSVYISQNSTVQPNHTHTGGLPDSVIYICLFLASVLGEVCSVPIKHYETGDGIFYQLIVSSAIWSSGIIVHWARGFPKMHGLAVVGGCLWTTGNINSVVIIKFLGIGLGSLFLNIIGLLCGWCTARFGLFGINKEITRNDVLNIIGVVLCTLSIVIFLFVKPEAKNTKPLIGCSVKMKQIGTNEDDDKEGLITSQNGDHEKSRLEKLIENAGDNTKRIVGISLTIFSGTMYGVAYTPIIYIQNNYKDASQDFNDYALAFSTGIVLTQMVYFIIYCIYERNSPKVYPQTIFPGLVTGWVWGISNTAYFIATNNLSQAITFPITNSGPCSVAFILGLIYREIKGKKNYTIISIGILLSISGSIFCGLSY